MNYASFFRSGAHVTALLAGLVVLTACSEKTAAPSKAGQWVAKVNDREITVHQVNAELNNAGPAAASLPADLVQRRMVETIVDRQLVIDAAAQAKLDRDPEVMQAIEHARQQVIAQAYLRKTLGARLTPSQSDIADYFNKNPDLFAKRKQLEMRQLSIDNASFNDDLAHAVDAARSLDEVETAFSAKNAKFVKGRVLRTSSDFPPQMRDNMDKLLSGKPFVVRTASNVIVATVSVTGEAPVSLQEATPQIAQYLINTRGQEATAIEVARLRKAAHIEYKTGYGPLPGTATEPAAGRDAPPSIERAAAGLR